MKLIKRFMRNLFLSDPAAVFYAAVKCSDCGEEINVRIESSTDFQIAYNAHNAAHCYTIKKEIIGKTCFNLMELTLALTKNAKVLFVDTKACEFLKFDKE
ncbi:MAG: hypothetical protein KJ957_01750 [Candidatus Omnitrophica bacterium]|nr:hypothetical protein [Candidatus Omnitrophota bacterium]MBU1852753.1 hypothetical protein [Candidatus Omnitrophota bacterium]